MLAPLVVLSPISGHPQRMGRVHEPSCNIDSSSSFHAKISDQTKGGWWMRPPPISPEDWMKRIKPIAMAAWDQGVERARNGLPFDTDLSSLGLFGFFAPRPIYAVECPPNIERVTPASHEVIIRESARDRVFALQYPDLGDDWDDKDGPVGCYIEDTHVVGEPVVLKTSLEWGLFFLEEVHRAYLGGQQQGGKVDDLRLPWPGWARSFMWRMNSMFTTKIPGQKLVPSLWETHVGYLVLDEVFPNRPRKELLKSVITTSRWNRVL